MALLPPYINEGDVELANNYRPIALTYIPCKMMEQIILHYLNKTLGKVLHHRQHGFRRGLSCQTQLCITFNDLAKASTDGYGLEKKTFDNVPHVLPLRYLQKISGLSTHFINWIHNLSLLGIRFKQFCCFRQLGAY